MVTTDPDYQRQGHASRLIKKGLEMADRDGRRWYAACWPSSAVVYMKLGFKFLAEETIDLSPFGGEGTVSLKLLVREPQLVK
jgi:GNAT superfamily N-acetyltransferase